MPFPHEATGMPVVPGCGSTDFGLRLPILVQLLNHVYVMWGRTDTLNCAASDSSIPIHFFALEWANPRLGRGIREINLKGSTGFRKCRTWHGVSDELVPSNALILLALSVVESREDGDDV